LPVSRETKLESYLGLLERWGRTVNLTSGRDRGRLRDHVDDSLTLIPHLPSDLDRLIDLGSGQGFPAIPIAIETGVAVHLIEADRRKAAFLTTALASLDLRGSVSPTRIEATVLPPARCVTARALAPLIWLTTAAGPFLVEGGFCLFLKGSGAEAELAAAELIGARGEIISGRPPTCLVKLTRLG
jgi:16S rRNA (guanine527-N7)-methyltransferase